jgi:hypothetical protein
MGNSYKVPYEGKNKINRTPFYFPPKERSETPVPITHPAPFSPFCYMLQLKGL